MKYLINIQTDLNEDVNKYGKDTIYYNSIFYIINHFCQVLL